MYTKYQLQCSCQTCKLNMSTFGFYASLSRNVSSLLIMFWGALSGAAFILVLVVQRLSMPVLFSINYIHSEYLSTFSHYAENLRNLIIHFDFTIRLFLCAFMHIFPFIIKRKQAGKLVTQSLSLIVHIIIRSIGNIIIATFFNHRCYPVFLFFSVILNTRYILIMKIQE